MQKLKNVFLLNKSLDSYTAQMLVYSQMIFLGIFWIFSPSVFLPTPSETYNAFIELWSMGVASELITSFNLNVQAILVATLVSLILSYITTIPFFRPIVALLSKLRFLSLVGLTFFFTLMTKNGHSLKLSILSFSISVFFITSMADVLNSIPKVQFDLARTLRMKEWQIVWEVIILGQIDKVFDVLRQNSAISWMMLTMVEGMSRSDGGIGAMLLNQNKHFHLSSVLVIQVMILIVGLFQDYIIGLVKRVMCPYASLAMEKK